MKVALYFECKRCGDERDNNNPGLGLSDEGHIGGQGPCGDCHEFIPAIAPTAANLWGWDNADLLRAAKGAVLTHSPQTPDPRKGFWEEGDQPWEFFLELSGEEGADAIGPVELGDLVIVDHRPAIVIATTVTADASGHEVLLSTYRFVEGDE